MTEQLAQLVKEAVVAGDTIQALWRARVHGDSARAKAGYEQEALLHEQQMRHEYEMRNLMETAEHRVREQAAQTAECLYRLERLESEHAAMRARLQLAEAARDDALAELADARSALASAQRVRRSPPARSHDWMNVDEASPPPLQLQPSHVQASQPQPQPRPQPSSQLLLQPQSQPQPQPRPQPPLQAPTAPPYAEPAWLPSAPRAAPALGSGGASSSPLSARMAEALRDIADYRTFLHARSARPTAAFTEPPALPRATSGAR